MTPFGSAVVDCQPAAGRTHFVVSARDQVFATFPAGDVPAADLMNARTCAASLSDAVFLSSSVERFWLSGGLAA
jgi:hypothetical protein